MVQIRMKRNLLVGCIVLIFVGISTIHAASEQCNQMFEAVVEMRGNLTAFMAGDQRQVQKLKKFAFYWTNVDVDDDVQLRRLVCQVVNANSLDEMAAAMRIPRTHFVSLYMGFKANALRYKMDVEETLLLSPPEMLTDAQRQAMRALVNVVNVAESVGLNRFNPPPPSRHPQPGGCRTMMYNGLAVYNDLALLLSTTPVNQQGKERFRITTGIDIDDRDQITAVLCKLGEVSDLTELAAVFNLPGTIVRGLYPRIVAEIRKIEGLIASGKVPPGIPEHLPRNMLKFLRGMQEVGLLDLTD